MDDATVTYAALLALTSQNVIADTSRGILTGQLAELYPITPPALASIIVDDLEVI